VLGVQQGAGHRRRQRKAEQTSTSLAGQVGKARGGRHPKAESKSKDEEEKAATTTGTTAAATPTIT
jgi:hypothetical protein